MQKTLVNENEIAEQAAHYFVHADWAFNPATESETAGRLRHAWELAVAMDWAERHGYEFEWATDPDIHNNPDCSECAMMSALGVCVQWRGAIAVTWDEVPDSDLAMCEMAELALKEMIDSTNRNVEVT